MHVEGRQGDVLLLRLSEEEQEIGEPEILKDRDQGDIILAYGEVTGHAHRISAENAEKYEVRLATGIEEYLRVVEEGGPVSLNHEEHATITLAPAVYAILHQEEYRPGEVPVYVRD
jgi:hypothetical protein